MLRSRVRTCIRFSAVKDGDGTISEVRYPASEPASVTAFKKSIAGLFSLSPENSEGGMVGSDFVLKETSTMMYNSQNKTTKKVCVHIYCDT